MKSPLVDALRLASGQDKAANNDTAQPEPETAAQSHDAAAKEAQPAPVASPVLPELSLMDATGILVVDSAAREDDEFATSQVVAEEAVNDEVPAVVPVAAEHPVVFATRADGRRPALARLGMFSPLLCLLLASAATGSYLLYQNAGGSLQGTGLGVPISEPGAAGGAGVAGEPGGPVNRFPLTADSRQSRPVQAPAYRAQAIAPAVSVTSERAPMMTSVRRSVDDRAFAVLNEAHAAYESGDLGSSEAAYRRALAIAPRHPNALQGLAAILQRTGRANEALGYYELLLAVEPGNTEAAAALLAGRSNAGSFATEAEMKVLLQQHPDSAHLHHALGTVMAQQGRWADARLAYYRAIAIEPRNAEYQFNLAVSLENLGQYDDARVRYEAALANVTDASAIDSQQVVARIAMLSERSANPGTVQ